MKRYRIYIWAAIYLILANVWLYHYFSTWNVFLNFFRTNQPPEWETLLAVIAGISLLPLLPIAKMMSEFSDVSGVAAIIINSVISILIYIPLIHLTRLWILTKHQSPSGMLGSIRQRAHDFSASLNPRGTVRRVKSDSLLKF
jgi:hypothetical protein